MRDQRTPRRRDPNSPGYLDLDAIADWMRFQKLAREDYLRRIAHLEGGVQVADRPREFCRAKDCAARTKSITGLCFEHRRKMLKPEFTWDEPGKNTTVKKRGKKDQGR